jgi:hypothetical protein
MKKYTDEPISKRLKSVTPAKADIQKRTENTGYRYASLRVRLSPELQQQTFEIGSDMQLNSGEMKEMGCFKMMI